jgi:glutamyl-tRNA reductase
LDDASWAHVERLASALVNKLLHEPATRLRAEAANGHARDDAEALRYLFDLPEEDGAPDGRS